MQTQARPGFWRAADGSSVASQEAYAAWAHAAYPSLITVAARYDNFITYKHLGDEIQVETDIFTSLLLQNWIGKVLALVVAETHHRGDPPLTALVVHADDGMVGEGYRLVLSTVGQAPIDDVRAREEHAAGARLECYRRFCPELPTDGGTPALTPKARTKLYGKQAAAETPAPTCPRCHVELPLSGICDECS